MRLIPVSASKTKMEYEVYRHEEASDEDFNGIWEFFKQVLREDKDLCTAAQKNLNGGIFLSGELHPRVEKVNHLQPLERVSHDIADWCCKGTLVLPGCDAETRHGTPQGGGVGRS